MDSLKVVVYGASILPTSVFAFPVSTFVGVLGVKVPFESSPPPMWWPCADKGLCLFPRTHSYPCAPGRGTDQTLFGRMLAAVGSGTAAFLLHWIGVDPALPTSALCGEGMELLPKCYSELYHHGR